MDANRHRRICVITSTRADWGLLQPVAALLCSRADVDLQIVATNMHLDPSRGMTVDEIIADGFEVTARVEMPIDDDTFPSAAHATARCLDGMADAFSRLQPDLIVILGDRFEMLAVATAATIMSIPIAHISGGEITEGAFDDNVRHALSKLSSLHFPTTEAHRQRLIAMGEEPGKVVNAGALGVSNMLKLTPMSVDELEKSLGFPLRKPLAIVTYHPATADDAEPSERFAALLKALDRHPGLNLLFTYPNNDPRSASIIEMIGEYVRRNPGRAHAIESLGRVRYLSALRIADMVVGNSSSGIVEVPSAGIPTVDIGIRQKGRTASESVIHCGDSADEIASAISEALSDEARNRARSASNPYAGVDTPALIAKTLATVDIATLLPKKFHDIK